MRIEEAVDMRIHPVINNTTKNSGNSIINRDSAAIKPDDSKRPDPEYKNDVLEKIIHDLNRKLDGSRRELRCSTHEKTGQVMVKVVDADSGKTIREIPPEKSLDILAKILEQSGLLLDEKT